MNTNKTLYSFMQDLIKEIINDGKFIFDNNAQNVFFSEWCKMNLNEKSSLQIQQISKKLEAKSLRAQGYSYRQIMRKMGYKSPRSIGVLLADEGMGESMKQLTKGGKDERTDYLFNKWW